MPKGSGYNDAPPEVVFRRLVMLERCSFAHVNLCEALVGLAWCLTSSASFGPRARRL